MADDAIDLNDPGMLELARRLEAYADARLSPSIAGTTRMRTSVMNAAHRRAALGAADGTFDAAGATTATLAADRRGAGARTWRRPVVAILAGSLTVAMLAGTASATKPGGPLYAARLWIEMANLPAEVVARAQAEINRLDARLQEAQQASSAGDGPAARAALSAYSVIVVEAARGSAGDPTASAAIEVTVTRHVVVLTLMVDSVPPPARDAVKDALSSSAMVLDDLDGAGEQDSRDGPIDADQSKATRPAGAKGDEPEPGRRACDRGGAAPTRRPSGPIGTPHPRRPTRAASPGTHAATTARRRQGRGRRSGLRGPRRGNPSATLTTRTATRPVHPTPERPDRRCTLT